MRFSCSVAVLFASYQAFAAAAPSKSTPVFETKCNGRPFAYQELAGYGFVASDARDKFGDTIGGIGSSIAIESWKKDGKSYEGILWTLPDRGWNTNGTLNVQNRVHKFKIEFREADDATVPKPSKPNLLFKYQDTVLLFGPDGKPTTGLDADATDGLSYPGFPLLPAATYKGDGFGGSGLGDKRISIDPEGLVLGDDDTFWISDEYGPYIYQFDSKGKLVKAVRPPDALIPRRNGTDSFNSNTAPYYDPKRTTVPANPTSGRANNQGFEGLTVSEDGRTLTVLTQSALMQEGGSSNSGRRYARLLKYDISGRSPTYLSEYVVPLPTYANANGNTRIAAQSEILALSSTQYLVLARDSGAGNGQDSPTSLYRHVDVFDISSATNTKSAANDAYNGSIASTDGVLKAGITPATYCPFVDFNINSQLNRFGVHNGPPKDSGLLNEKWEGLALAPVKPKHGKAKGRDKGDDEEYFLFALSDNDFITQNGFLNFGKFRYSDQSGYNLDNQALVFKVKLPK